MFCGFVIHCLSKGRQVGFTPALDTLPARHRKKRHNTPHFSLLKIWSLVIYNRISERFENTTDQKAR